MADLLSWA
uniref:Uncharacterized protein n=1 Tax=Anguilla anguilla TaxID=7936 RepID=A0A0E9QAZ6_ANGAN